MFNPFIEFPHAIQIGIRERGGVHPNEYERFKSEKVIYGFMDTPTTNEQLQYHQMDNSFDRNLYTSYDLPIDANKTLFKYEGRIYECIGEPVDQGGQNEINLTKLKVTPIGKG